MPRQTEHTFEVQEQILFDALNCRAIAGGSASAPHFVIDCHASMRGSVSTLPSQ